MLRAMLFDTVTGRLLVEVPYLSASWERRILSADGLKTSVTLRDRAVRALGLRNVGAAGKSTLGIFDGDHCLGAGPIWRPDYDADSQQLDWDASGIWSLLDTRFVMPDSVSSTPLLVQSGETEGEANPAVATVYTGQSWPYIVRSLLQQMMSRPGGQLPLVFGPDGAGSHDIRWDASEFTTVGEALSGMCDLIDGPEIEFLPRLRADAMGIEWVVRVSDDAQPELKNSGPPHVFDFSVRDDTIRGLKVAASAESMASETWATGGRKAAKALISRAYSPALVNVGWPRMESVSSAHSTVEEQGTLDRYVQADLRRAEAPLEWWSFETDMDKTPRVTDVSVGDYCRIIVADDPYLPDGDYLRRIVGLSGDEKSRWMRVTTDEVVAHG